MNLSLKVLIMRHHHWDGRSIMANINWNLIFHVVNLPFTMISIMDCGRSSIVLLRKYPSSTIIHLKVVFSSKISRKANTLKSKLN
jgi:hypothetical protein